MTVETTAFIPTSDGRVRSGSTMLVDGAVHPIPDRTDRAGVLVVPRVVAGLAAAGWVPAGGWDASVRDVDGGFEVAVRPASEEEE